jgi:hypothetical protein
MSVQRFRTFEEAPIREQRDARGGRQLQGLAVDATIGARLAHVDPARPASRPAGIAADADADQRGAAWERSTGALTV